MHTVFIDGQAGTTGLQIKRRLKDRSDIELVEIDADKRKDPVAKKKIVNEVDAVILCLPDAAARDAVGLVDTSHTKILDASSAHRVHKDWVYGLPELLPRQRKLISEAERVSNPGCHATGFLLAMAPLISTRLVPVDMLVNFTALSGYSGGGRSLIEKYEARKKSHPHQLWHARPYGLDLTHKHLPEMREYSCLEKTPLFTPFVSHFYQGLLISVPLFREHLAFSTSITNVQENIVEYYENEPCIKVHPLNNTSSLDDGFLDPEANNGTNRLDLFVFGTRDQILLIARLDNLGKGASGAAVQNLNLMLGLDELTGLEI